MAVHLSRLAKYYVADFLNYRDVLVLPGDWCAMFEVFDSGSAQRHRMPLPEYAVTKEFDLGLRTGVLPTKVEYLFNGGPGATFWYRVPAGFISAIVQVSDRRCSRRLRIFRVSYVEVHPDPQRVPPCRRAGGSTKEDNVFFSDAPFPSHLRQAQPSCS